ncbi:GNAT family N-acetyltransferase [Schumannella soli]|uniref:GNAT family N-acetyltransferase n=1 Tax=Schumannella soli TaxID=2590779 RepID=A0A506Y8F9_9MICO|nr:GNAT family N-acetyltransferase [Schumannella soli]TPW77477.1 GNAT family N-acetyltransferase [Schumannella soli]
MSADEDLELLDRPPTAIEHRELFDAVGWGDHMTDHERDVSLRASVVGVIARSRGQTVGMARVLGDGIHYFGVHDVVVHPDRQGEQIAERLLERLIQLVTERAGARARLELFASDEAVELYRGFGFTERGPLGMSRAVHLGVR